MLVSGASTPVRRAASGPPSRMVLIRSYTSFRRSCRRWSSIAFKSSCRDGLMAFSIWISESIRLRSAARPNLSLSKIRAGTDCAIQRILGVKRSMTDRSEATKMYLWQLGLNAFVGSRDPRVRCRLVPVRNAGRQEHRATWQQIPHLLTPNLGPAVALFQGQHLDPRMGMP